MAKPGKDLNLKPGCRVRKAARLLLLEAVGATFACQDAARRGEVEAGIHDMRVAAKRLREQMRLFRPVYHRAEFADSLARVDALNDDLGLVRDADVLAEHLGLLTVGPDELSGELLRAIEADRARHQSALNQVLDELAEAGFADRLAEVVVLGRHGRGHPVAGQRLRRFARTAVLKRLDKVIRRLAEVKGEEDVQGLHRLRVANKQLRYAIEPFLAVFDRRLQTAYKRVAELHTALGDLHDLDVLRSTLASFADGRGAQDEAAGWLSQIDGLRSREFGRAQTFLDPSGDLTFIGLVADAVD